MKKTFVKVLVLVLLAVAGATVAQAQIKYGPMLGANLANIKGDFDDDNAMKFGMHIGGVVDIGISDNFSIMPGALFSMKGTQSDEESKYKTNLNYIEIPVLAKYQLESGLNFSAGPYLGLLMSAKATDGDNDVDIKDDLAGTDIGLKFGLGYQLESGLGFNVNYGLGMTTIADDSDIDSKNNVIGISVMYLLGGN